MIAAVIIVMAVMAAAAAGFATAAPLTLHWISTMHIHVPKGSPITAAHA
jgi:hypothetical protein